MTAVPGGGTELGPVSVGATRRTTTLLIVPHGSWADGQAVTAIGRDLTLPRDGEMRSRDERFAFDVDRAGVLARRAEGRTLPAELSGLPAQRGLRKAMARLRAERPDGGDTIFGPVGGLYETLLDDLVGTSLASGYGRLYEGSVGADGAIASRMMLTCVGFSTMHRRGEEFDVQRYFETKPPSVEFVPADPLAWHDDVTMPPNAFRRRRLLEVAPAEDGVVPVVGYFRDTFMRPDGVEMVVHEYGLTASVSGDPLVLDRVQAVPGNLPLEHCPLAAGSTARLEGLPLADVEAVVRREVAGPSGCTHLNDELRSLRLVRALLAPDA